MPMISCINLSFHRSNGRSMKPTQYPGTEILTVEMQSENQSCSLQQMTDKEKNFRNKPSVAQTTSMHIWTQWRGEVIKSTVSPISTLSSKSSSPKITLDCKASFSNQDNEGFSRILHREKIEIVSTTASALLICTPKKPNIRAIWESRPNSLLQGTPQHMILEIYVDWWSINAGLPLLPGTFRRMDKFDQQKEYR